MKNFIKTCRNGFTYVTSLLINLLGLLELSRWGYVLANENSLIVYGVNVAIILLVLADEKFEDAIFEKLYYKLKDGGFLKRRLKKRFAKAAYKPTIKTILYIYYLLCIAAERILYFGVAENIIPIDADIAIYYKEFLSIMYYSFILFMAIDKTREIVSKESKSRKKYYDKFDEEGSI